ncbi:hypothetical protein BDF14DRAFT_1272848 [Spinellus fusiger]|nr:hypothetical protein BDF14DRAFT_1272848 [Spinellus fusiger]
MNQQESLISAIVNYSRVIEEASSPRVASWHPVFLDHCLAWCLYIETELAVLPTEKREQCYQQAGERWLCVPPLAQLFNARYSLYEVLISNSWVSHDLFIFITKTYASLEESQQTPKESQQSQQTLHSPPLSYGLAEASSLSSLLLLTPSNRNWLLWPTPLPSTLF